ncbi:MULTISPECIES: hypothetical protein [Caballeronia]|uniref:hypothetical protein n=1 Tax=Caballeronia TaxID=1827195 RepID=UPI001FD60CDF|nr:MULTISPECIES: hypothetical protein [Caballeronia]MDR5799093.1 hypothetical protein [Caballeronia sp. LZ001]
MSLNTEAFAADLRRLKIPPPDRNTLMGVYDLEGDYITKAVPECDRDNERALHYLRGIFFTVTPTLKERLQRRNMMIPSLKVLVEIGKREGPQFARRLKQWDEAGEDGDDSRYVRLTMAKFLQQEAEESNGTSRPQQSPNQRQGNGQAHERQQRHGPRTPAAQDGSASAPAPDRRQQTQQSSRPSSNQSGQNRPPPPPQQRQQPPEATRGQRQPDDRDDSPAPPGEDVPQQQEKDYLSQHIYGGKAAACFSADTTRSGTATVRIEAAESKGQRQYDWKDKVSIQLSSRELPLVLATMMQWLPLFEGKGHGANNEKWFALENQAGKLYLSVNCKGKNVRGVPIMAGDAYSICTLIMRQMLKNDPFLSSEALLMIVKKQGELHLGGQRGTAGNAEGNRRPAREQAYAN